MGALTATTPTNTGTTSSGDPVAASDTISTAVMGREGVYLEIDNANASPDDITISDAGETPSGNALSGGTIAAQVAAGASKVFHIHPEQADRSTGLVTVTHSVTSAVTYKLYPV